MTRKVAVTETVRSTAIGIKIVSVTRPKGFYTVHAVYTGTPKGMNNESIVFRTKRVYYHFQGG